MIVMKPFEPITGLLDDVHRGKVAASDELMPQVYAHLRRVAASHLRRERRGHTLQVSDLIQEACLRLVKPGTGPWKNRQHFFSVASRSMRQVLVDHARAHTAQKRGAGPLKFDWEIAVTFAPGEAERILAVHEALQDLARLSKRQCRVVELRYFGGLTLRETAAVLHVGITTVKEDWDMAKSWLQRELGQNG
jgi:RNA polymerase sigma factor (TIGR02999 family)